VKRYAVQLAFGIAFGYVFSRGGFSDWREVHGMFSLTNWNPAIAFATVLAITAPLWFWLKRRAARPVRRPVHPGSIPGGIIFGVGWVFSGACPALALAQLGEGKGMALVTLAGIVAGNWGYAAMHERYFRWHTASCADD
jgi:uncharacterized membrane protein YedE/YeeE